MLMAVLALAHRAVFLAGQSGYGPAEFVAARNASRKSQRRGVQMPNTNRVYRVAVIPGDGIGKEVVPEGVRALEAVSKKFGFEVRQDWFDFASYDYYAKHDRMMPED